MSTLGERATSFIPGLGGGGGGRESNFKVKPKNILGLDARKTRSKLLALALSKPEDYYKLREEVIEKMTENAVDEIYNTFWSALTDGIVGGNQINIPGGGAFQPNLPESDVNKFALKCANAIYEISQEAVESILPNRFKELAIDTQEAILTEKGVKI
jgi:hypothetical protein